MNYREEIAKLAREGKLDVNDLIEVLVSELTDYTAECVYGEARYMAGLPDLDDDEDDVYDDGYEGEVLEGSTPEHLMLPRQFS